MSEHSSCKLKFEIHRGTLPLPFSAKLMRSQMSPTGEDRERELEKPAVVQTWAGQQAAICCTGIGGPNSESPDKTVKLRTKPGSPS